nr:SDR family oxidoreductase [Harryflintia acetispora]
MIRVNQIHQYSEVKLFDCGLKQLDNAPNYHSLTMSLQSDIEESINGADLIYFFVGKTGTMQGFEDPELFLKVNEGFLFSLLNAYRAVHSTAKIIFPSTRLVYRGDSRALNEDSEKQFLTPYAIQKFACEQYLNMYHELFGVNYCILRIGVPYGTLVHPVSSYGTLEFFIKQAKEFRKISVFGDGKQKRTFTFIEDLCHILWKAGLTCQCINDVYNIGGEALSIREVAEKVAYATKAIIAENPWPHDFNKIESGDTVFDSRKLDCLLGNIYSMTVDRWLGENDIR